MNDRNDRKNKMFKRLEELEIDLWSLFEDEPTGSIDEEPLGVVAEKVSETLRTFPKQVETVKNYTRMIYDWDIEDAAVELDEVAKKLLQLLEERKILCDKLRSLGVEPEQLVQDTLNKE